MLDISKDQLSKNIPSIEVIHIHNGIPFVKDFLSTMFNYNELTLFDYSIFGKTLSTLLLEHSYLNEYKDFVNKYNETIDSFFSEQVQFYNDILRLGEFMMFVLKSDLFHIEDKTDIFKSYEFQKELDLENTLYESFKSWFDDEKWSIGRQQFIGCGISDLIIESKIEKYAIELKKGEAKRMNVYQTFEYTRKNSGFKGILIASDFNADIIDLAKDLSIDCYIYGLGFDNNSKVPISVYLDKLTNITEQNEFDNELNCIQTSGGHLIEYKRESYISVFDKSVRDKKELHRVIHEICDKQLQKFN